MRPTASFRAQKSKCLRSEDFCYNQIPYFKKKYYVRVRSCARTENDNNKKAYSAWSKVKTVTVK